MKKELLYSVIILLFIVAGVVNISVYESTNGVATDKMVNNYAYNFMAYSDDYSATYDIGGEYTILRQLLQSQRPMLMNSYLEKICRDQNYW